MLEASLSINGAWMMLELENPLILKGFQAYEGRILKLRMFKQSLQLDLEYGRFTAIIPAVDPY